MLDLFTQADWERIQDTYERWWTRTLERPVIHLNFQGKDPGMRRPEGLITSTLYKYPLDEPAERIAEKLEYILRSQEYVCDAYPYVWMNLGPISDVEFFGVKADIHDNTVWYHAENVPPPEEHHIGLSPGSVFFPRYKAIAKACDDRFQTGYAAGCPPHGGHCLDGVAEFYGPMELSYMLFDQPDEVNRLCREYHAASREARDQLLPLTPNARGYTGWGGIFAPEPWAVLQCDYCAMIGQEHFEKFVKWDMELTVSESPRYNFYHLDGPGELIHLDSILSMPDLKCVQWVPGAGVPQEDGWPEVYRKISDAGKNMWVLGPIENAEIVADQIGTTKGIFWSGEYPIEEYDRVMKIVERLTSGR